MQTGVDPSALSWPTLPSVEAMPRHNESNSNAFRLASIVTLPYLLVLVFGV